MTQKKTEAPEGKDPPADNNKRLAFLEAASTKLGDAMIAAGLMEEDSGEEPVQAAEPELIRLGRMDQRAAKLREFLGERDIELEDGEHPVDAVMRQFGELEKQAADNAEAAGNGEDADRIDALEDQVRSLTEDLEKANAELAKANRTTAAQIRKGAKPAKARKVGPLKDGTDRKALVEAIDSGKEMEIVLSNGTAEIAEFDPVLVSGAGFYRRGAERFDLIEPLIVKGAGQEKRVRGVGLLVGGKQIAWTEFPRTVSVPEGQQVKFDRMINF